MLKKVAIVLSLITYGVLLSGCTLFETSAQKEHVAWAESIYQAALKKDAIEPLTIERDITVEDAYRIQAVYNSLMQKTYGKPVGYKVAYASKASQQKWNIDAPTFGTFFAKQRVENGGTVKAEDFILFHNETEIAFIIAKDIKTPIKTIDELMPYLKSIHVGLDVPDNRFDRSKGSIKVADVIAMSCGTHTYVLGDGVDPKHVDFKKMQLSLEHNERTVYAGVASNVMGDPREAVLILARHLQLQGYCLKTGDVVLSGAVAGAYCPKTTGARKGSYVGKATGLPSVKLVVK